MSYQVAKPSEEDSNKNYNFKNKNKNLHVSSLHIPEHNMNAFKLMQAQSKAINSTFSTSRCSGSGHVRSQGAPKRPAEGQEMNALMDSAVLEVLEQKIFTKAAATHDSGLEDDLECFNLEKLSIR